MEKNFDFVRNCVIWISYLQVDDVIVTFIMLSFFSFRREVDMLIRTHVAFAILFILFFIRNIENKFIFVIFVLIATIIPDLDSKFSSYGRHLIFRPLQFFTVHRGILHSFTTAVIVSGILAVFWPKISFAVFIGYSIHLLCDCFTKEGVQPFWPLKMKACGSLRSGGKVESLLFIGIIFVDIFLFFTLLIFGLG